MYLHPYDPKNKDMFNKCVDYVVRLKTGEFRVAGLFRLKDGSPEYYWVTVEHCSVLDDDSISHWAALRV